MMIRTSARITAILMSLLMVFAMTPLAGAQHVYGTDTGADANDGLIVPGGTVTSNSAEEALAAFTSDQTQSATSDYDSDSQTLTITLNSDVTLEAPVKFVKGEAEDQVVLDLKGHTITAKAGQPGTDRAKARGGNAIEIIAADYDVEVKGPGAVVGGEGAAFETEDHLKQGADGGMAVCFAGNEDGSFWCPAGDSTKLCHGLRITGGAVITGGAGAEMSGDDWIYNIEKYSGDDRYSFISCPQFSLRGGTGGAGLGQVDTGIKCAATTLSYARIDVMDGTIRGGAGGRLDLGSPGTPVLTHYSLMNCDAISAYMDAKNWANTSNYDDYVSRNISLRAGDGGDGIVIGAGRKYVCVEEASEVQGGMCGEIDYGQSKTLDGIGNDRANAGNGIMVYGDVGLENLSAGQLSGDYGGKDSPGMGIFIEGTVTGGSTPDVYAMHEDSGNAGDGIVLDGEEEYISFGVDYWGHNMILPFLEGEDYVHWGAIEVEGLGVVRGGSAGSTVCGGAGDGGDGIREAYTKGDDYTDDSPIGTDHYHVNGNVYGGNGGNRFAAKSSAGEGGAGGGPGNGISFGNYRKNAHIYGNGVVEGGDWGDSTVKSSTDLALGQGIRFYPDPEDLDPEDLKNYGNTVADTLLNVPGDPPRTIDVNNEGLSVSASMTSFKDYPTTSTKLGCKVNTPSDYSGDVYIQWIATLQLQNNEAEVGILEPSGTDATSFCLLSNDQYKYLAYPMFKDRPELGNDYNEDIVTVDRIRETIEYQRSYAEIDCYVFLEDGRWARSKTMKFTKEGWKDTSGGSSQTDDPPGSGDDPDQKAANTLTVKGKTVNLKAKILKKKSRTLKAGKVIRFVDKGQGKRTYKLSGVTKAKYKKYFKVNKRTGKLTVKKGLKKGTYKVKIKVTAAGDEGHNKATGTATARIRVK